MRLGQATLGTFHAQLRAALAPDRPGGALRVSLEGVPPDLVLREGPVLAEVAAVLLDAVAELCGPGGPLSLAAEVGEGGLRLTLLGPGAASRLDLRQRLSDLAAAPALALRRLDASLSFVETERALGFRVELPFA